MTKTATCLLIGCNDLAQARGLCRQHYDQLKNHDLLSNVLRHYGNPEARFNDSYDIDDESGCWIWKAGMKRKGQKLYPRFCVGQKSLPATRYAYRMKQGSDPDGDLVRTCKNHHCVNPDHYILVVSRGVL